MQWVYFSLEELKDDKDNTIFNMCKNSYQTANVRFTYDKDGFFNRNKNFLCYIDKNDSLRVTLVINKYTYAYKILLLCHDGTEYAKQILFNKLAQLIATPGYIVELSGKPSWIIRSRYNLKPITDKNTIQKLLDADKKGFEIIMNDNYDVNEKESYVYQKKVRIKGEYVLDSQNLFGIGCPPSKSFVDMRMDGYNCVI